MPFVSSNGPSLAEVMQQIQLKKHIVLWPKVSDLINNLKEVKSRQSKENPDQDYPTIVYADLVSALRAPSTVKVEDTNDVRGWKVVVDGQAKDGWKLSISLYLDKDDIDSLLIITNFELLRQEGEPST